MLPENAEQQFRQLVHFSFCNLGLKMNKSNVKIARQVRSLRVLRRFTTLQLPWYLHRSLSRSFARRYIRMRPNEWCGYPFPTLCGHQLDGG